MENLNPCKQTVKLPGGGEGGTPSHYFRPQFGIFPVPFAEPAQNVMPFSDLQALGAQQVTGVLSIRMWHTVQLNRWHRRHIELKLSKFEKGVNMFMVTIFIMIRM